jgi:hypothetical protein
VSLNSLLAEAMMNTRQRWNETGVPTQSQPQTASRTLSAWKKKPRKKSGIQDVKKKQLETILISLRNNSESSENPADINNMMLYSFYANLVFIAFWVVVIMLYVNHGFLINIINQDLQSDNLWLDNGKNYWNLH